MTGYRRTAPVGYEPRGAGAGEAAGLAELDDPESVVVPILIDALLLVESYRGARHQISFLSEMTASVDALLRDLTINEKAKEWAGD